MAVLDLGITYGASYSINFATDIIANAQGIEQRRSLFSQPLIKVAIGNKPITKTELDYIRDFFASVQGRFGEFEIRDWSDYQVTGGTLGPVIEGRQSVIKTYTVGGESVSRLLTAVVEDTITSGPGGVSCEFNIPVRFDQDFLPVIFEAYSASQENLFLLQDLTCTEVRKPWPDMAIATPPLSVAASLTLGKDYQTLGGDNFSTSIVSLPSGWDNRQANYTGAIGTWNIGDRILNKTELEEFIAMFRVCRGRLATFDFYDWQSEESKSVRFDSDNISFQFEAYQENYYGEGSKEALFAINGVPLRSVESPFSKIDKETYVITLFDSSGSMDNVLPTLISSTNQLRILLKDLVYGSQELADKYVKPVISFSHERYLLALSEDYRDDINEPQKCLFLVFENENGRSELTTPTDYHRTPRDLGFEPSPTYLSDLPGFIDAYQDFVSFNCLIFIPTSSPPIDYEIAFNAHARDAINGYNGYSPLSFYNVAARYNWPINATGLDIFASILEFL